MNTSRPSDLPRDAPLGLDTPVDDGRWDSHPNRTRVVAQTRIVALPRYPATGLADHLGQVDVLLVDSLDDLTRLWTTELDDQAHLDVLGSRDLPMLIQQLLQSGGKRIRPAMCYLGWLAASGAERGVGRAEVVTVGAALELLHVFALIHDDVMDESASRRGQPSVHAQASRMHVESKAKGSARRFGESIAMLVGDLAHAEADQLAAGLPAEMRRIWRILVVELVCGQRRDLTGSVAGRRDLGHARQVARMKSGSYTVERPLQLGAAAAQAPAPVLTSLGVYGREVGEAFALRDDLLGVWGDPTLTGKPAGDDLLSGKPTVILALAQQRARGATRMLLDRVGTSELTSGDVAVLQHELKECGVVDAVESTISTHLARALSALDAGLLRPEGIAGLTQMAHQIAWRNR
ncbi:MAG: polyprenyl synthetase family protein [Propionibacteriaceae bacterium]|nr:polyprenyl synthetase family protein [Propionibacteriaceae bacterium]